MSIDLSERVVDLRAACSPPGENLYPASVDADWLARLLNGFWEAVLEGMIAGYAADDDGTVDPTTVGGADMSRETQQVVVLFAAWKVVLQKLLGLKAEFEAQAGPVKFKTAQSATVLKGLADQIRAQLDSIVKRLGEGSRTVNTHVFDSVMARTCSIAMGDSWWLG